MKIKKELRDLTEKEFEEWRSEKKCSVIMCRECPFAFCDCSNYQKPWYLNKDMYSDKFLDQKIEIEVEKPKPTKDEIAFLKMVQPEYNWIAKNKSGIVAVYYRKPKKENFWYCGPNFYFLDAFNLNFDFLSWEDEEPTNIQELIKEYDDGM